MLPTPYLLNRRKGSRLGHLSGQRTRGAGPVAGIEPETKAGLGTQRSERGAENDESCRAPTAIQEVSECRGNGVAATSLGSTLAKNALA